MQWKEKLSIVFFLSLAFSVIGSIFYIRGYEARKNEDHSQITIELLQSASSHWEVLYRGEVGRGERKDQIIHNLEAQTVKHYITYHKK